MLPISVIVSVLMFISQASFSVIRKDSELILVQVIFRHGARTTYSTYPTDPYINETYYPFGLGALTNVGKRMEHKLGEYLREYYSDFIGKDYQANEVYVRSTGLQRTRASALLVLAGMFPPSEGLVWHDELLWQPIPVDYVPKDKEDVFCVRFCDRKIQLQKALKSDPYLHKTYVEPYQDLFEKITNKSGMEIKDPLDLKKFYLILTTELEQNLTLPEWTNDIYPEPILRVASLYYEYVQSDPELKKTNSGYLLKYLVDNIDGKINGTMKERERKLYLLSAHETTLGYMLNTLLNETQYQFPPYSSALAFELHKLDDDYFLKLKYKNGTFDAQFSDLKLPNCDILCPIQEFKNQFSNVIPRESIEEWCGEDRGQNDMPAESAR